MLDLMRNSLLHSFRPFLLASVVSFGLVGLAGSASAQTSVLTPTVSTGFLVGPIGGINLVAYNTDAFPILNSEPTCFLAQNGSDIAPWGGFTVEYPLGNPELLQNFIVGEVLYDSKSSKFSAVNGSNASIPTKENGFTATGSVNTALTADLNYLLINLAYKYNFTPGPSPVGPGLQVGPSVGVLLKSQFNKTVTVTAISPTATANDQTVSATVSAPSPVDGAQKIRLALRAMVIYDIPFTQEWIATPTVGYDFPITKVDNTIYNWRASSVFAGIAFRYFIKG